MKSQQNESTVRGLLWLGPGLGSVVHLMGGQPNLDLAMFGVAYFLFLPLLVFLSTGRLGRCLGQFGLTLALGFFMLLGCGMLNPFPYAPGFKLMWFLGIQFGVANFLTPQRVNLLSLLGQALPILALAWRAQSHPFQALVGMTLALASLLLGSMIGRWVKDQAQPDSIYGS